MGWSLCAGGSNLEAVLLSKTKRRITYEREGERCLLYKEEGNKHMHIACICKRDIRISKVMIKMTGGRKSDGVVYSFL